MIDPRDKPNRALKLTAAEPAIPATLPWVCVCGAANHQQRDFCQKCDRPRIRIGEQR